MGKMQQFKREIRSANGKQFAFDLNHGFGAVLGGLFERIARGKVHDAEIKEIFGTADEDGEQPVAVRILAGPQMTPSAKAGKYTALVSLHGVALYNLEFQPYCFSTLLFSQIMEQLANDPSVDTIVLDIDTPGGHVTGTKEAGDAVWAARKKKPVIGIVNALCASAGYWIASQCTKLIGVPSADVGSIGVFMCHYDCSKMMNDAGIKPTFIYAGEHKVEGNSMEPLSEGARNWFQSEVDDTYTEFLATVARGRGISADDVLEKFGKGRCFGAPMAKRVGMIDEIAPIKLALKSVGLNFELPIDGRRRGEAEQPSQAANDEPAPQAAQVEDKIDVVQADPAGAEAFAIRQEANGETRKFFVTGPWPAKTRISNDLATNPKAPMAVVGDTITIAVENGAAVYMKAGEHDGCWICTLAPDSSYEPAPSAEDKAEADRKASAAARRRRLAILAA